MGADDSGVRIALDNITVAGNAVFHGGNANCADADWTMRDAKVAGTLSVAGAVELSGTLPGPARRSLGTAGKTQLLLGTECLTAFADLALAEGCGIRMGGYTVLKHVSETEVQALGRKGQPLARRRPHLAYPAALGTDGYG